MTERTQRFLLLLSVSAVLFVRPPTTGFVFDEQEALLASPVLRTSAPITDVFTHDFWGLPSDRSIGSYRPLVVLVWKLLSPTLALGTPFVFQLVNVVAHAANAFLLLLLAERLGASSKAAFGAALGFACLAISSETVCSVVCLADLLAASAILGASLLALVLPLVALLPVTLLLLLAALLCKETAMAGLVLLPLAALIGRRSVLAALAVGLGSAGALVLSVCARSELFLRGRAPAPPPALDLPGLGPLLTWLRPPRMPLAPLENPLVSAEPLERVATGLAVFAKQCLLTVFPVLPSGDYSAPRQPAEGFGPFALLGALLVLAFMGVSIWGARRRSAPLALGGPWVVLATLPIANVFVLLPTVRADRLAYLPAVGLLLLVSVLLTHLETARRGRIAVALSLGLVFLLAFQASQARAASMRYVTDLAFWEATAIGPRPNAKAELNLGIMLGARGDLPSRIAHTRRAAELAPTWATAHVYLGDALCRSGQVHEASEPYVTGIALSPNSQSNVALALQCLWDRGGLGAVRSRLDEIAARSPGSWLDYLLGRLDRDGVEQGGVPREYRPRGYNESGDKEGS